MKICPNCQGTIQDNAEICPYCLYSFEVKKLTPIPDPLPNPKTMPGPEHLSRPDSSSRPESLDVWKPPVKGILAAIIIMFIFIIVGSSIHFGSVSGNKDSAPVADIAPVEVEETEKAAEREESEEDLAKEDVNLEQDEYVLSFSDSRYLTERDLEGLSASDLRIARNEIYARHHRLFDDEGLQNYFNGCSWYEGHVSPSDFSEAYAASVFNEYELYNKDFILAYEKNH